MTDAELMDLIDELGHVVLQARRLLYLLCEERKRRRGKPPEPVKE